MALQKRLVNIPFTDGVDTKTDGINLVPTKLAGLLNMRFPNKGAVSPRKQITTLTTFTPTTSGFVTGLRDVIYAEVNNRLYQVAGATTTDLVSSWSPDGTLIPLGSSGVIQSGSSLTGLSAATLDSGDIFTAWGIQSTTDDKIAYQFLSSTGEYLTGGSLIIPTNPTDTMSSAGPNNEGYIWVRDLSAVFRGYKVSGTTITTLTVPALSFAPLSIKWSSVDNAFLVLFNGGGNLSISKWTVSGTTVTAGTPTVLSASPCLVADVTRSTNYIIAAYWENSGGAVKCDYLSSSLVLATSRTITTDATSYNRKYGFGITVTNDSIDEVVLSYTPVIHNSGITMSTFQVPRVGTITTIRNLTAVGFYCITTPVYYNGSVYAAASDAVVAGAQTNSFVRIADLVGSPNNPIESVCFWNSGSATTVHPWGLQGPSVSSSGDNPGHIAMSSTALFIPCEAFTTTTSSGYNSTTLSAGIAASNITYFSSSGPVVAQVMKLEKTQNANTEGYTHKTSSFILGPNLKGIDGTGVAPGCLWPNFTPVNMELATTASPLVAGTYFFVFRKVWVDSLGNFQSLESLPIKVVAEVIAGTPYLLPKFTVPLGAFSLPNKSSGGAQHASIEVYRTETNGTIPYQFDTLEYTNAGVYTTSNNTLNLSFPLPSASGELSTTPPPPVRASISWKGRIAVLVGDNSTKVWYTKAVENYAFPAFANGLEIDIPQSSDPLNALASMDGVLYAFNINQVFTVYGDPAGNTGEGGSLTIPEIRFNGVGCDQPKSVILTPKGIFFSSAKGFYVILRNQELVFIGDGPFSTRGENILGAWCDEATSEVGFVYSDHAWVYDWEAGAWSKAETALTDGYNITGGALVNHELVLLNAAGIYQVTDEDVEEEFPIQVETGWIHLQGLQDYQRVYRLLLLFTQHNLLDHTLSIDLYIDYRDTVVHTWTIDSTALSAIDPEQIDLSMPIQKCEAFKLRISSDVGGWKLHGLNAEIGIKGSRYLNRQPANSY